MQPNLPPPAPPPMNKPEQELNPYDFLQAPPVKPKKTIMPSNNSTLQRLLIVIGIIVTLVIAFLVFQSFLNKAGKENTANLVEVAKQQTELIRIAEVGITKAKFKATKNLALTTKLSLETDQPELLKAIASSGTKIDKKSLASGQSASVDAALKQAEQDNRFDEVFMQIMVKQLQEYQLALKKAYDGAVNKKLKESINVDYVHVNLIIGDQAKQ